MSCPNALCTKTSSICKKPNTFIAQDAEKNSKAELRNYWSHVFCTGHSNIAQKLLGKAISYDFVAASERHPTDMFSLPKRNPFNRYNVLRVGLNDQLLNIAPLFALDWCAAAFMASIGFPCFILTHCGICFSTFLFLQEFLHFF